MANFKHADKVSIHTCPKCGHCGQRYQPLCFNCRERTAKPRPKATACINCGKVGQRGTDLCKTCKALSLPDYRGYTCTCGKPKDFSSKQCTACHHSNPWSESEDNLIRAMYPSKGAAILVPLMPTRTYNQIRDRAYKLGVVLSKKMYRKIVHDKAAEFMRQDNPSQRPGAKERLKKQAKALSQNPEIALKMLKGSQKRQQGTPSKLEIKLFSILEHLRVKYQSHVIVKPKFIVDVLIGNVIIQADGDWWHGHPRFYPLMARQHKQQLRDRAQDAYLSKCGYIVIRIWESDMSLDYVQTALTIAGALIQPMLLSQSVLPLD